MLTILLNVVVVTDEETPAGEVKTTRRQRQPVKAVSTPQFTTHCLSPPTFERTLLYKYSSDLTALRF